MHFADRIAYINHDIDDALRAGVLKRDDLPRGCVATLGDTHGKRLNTMIADIVTSSAGRDEVKMSDEIWQASMELRTFLFSRVYSRDWAAGEEKKADHVVEALYRYYAEHPGRCLWNTSRSAIARGWSARLRLYRLYDRRIRGRDLPEAVRPRRV